MKIFIIKKLFNCSRVFETLFGRFVVFLHVSFPFVTFVLFIRVYVILRSCVSYSQADTIAIK